MKKITFEDIIETLTEWRSNIECDVNNELVEPHKRGIYIIQTIQLSSVIGILEGLGENKNISYDTTT